MIHRSTLATALQGILRRMLAVAIAVALAYTAAGAETNHEFWPELDTWVRLSQSLQLLFVTAGTRDRDSGDRTDGEGGAYLDYRMSEAISLRGGFDDQRNIAQAPGEQDSIELRGVFDFNYRWRIGDQGMLTDRARIDIRDIEDEVSYRVRNRLRYEREIKLSRTTLTPYANIEFYYDSRYDTVSRLRAESGTTVPFGRMVEGDFYVGWQRDTRPQSKDVLGFGITLNLKF